MRTGMRVRRYSARCRRPRSSRCSGRPASGKTSVAIALAERLRADGEDPVAVSADALQVYRGLETLTGAATRDEQARLEHRLLVVPARGRAVQRGRVRAPRAPRDRRPARRRPAPDRGRRHRPVPARRARRARPAPAGPGRRSASAAAPSSTARGPQALHEELAARAPADARSAPPTPSGSCARSSCSTPATSRRRPATAAVDGRHPPPDGARRPGDGARGAQAAHRRARRRDGRRRARSRRSGAAARGRVRDRPQGARLRASCWPATSRP